MQLSSDPVALKLREKLRGDWDLLVNSVTTLRSSMKKCEGIGIKADYSFEESESFDSADEVIQIRDLRNSIAHEYEEADIRKIYADTTKLAPLLIKTIESTGRFLTDRNLFSVNDEKSGF